MTWESGGDQNRTRAKQVYEDFKSALDKFSTLSVGWNADAWKLIKDFGLETLALINLGFAGDMNALDRAEEKIRELDSVYHAAPASLKRPARTVTETDTVPRNRDLEIQRLIEAFKPPTGWKKWRDLVIAGPVFTIIGSVGTLLVLRLLGLLG